MVMCQNNYKYKFKVVEWKNKRTIACLAYSQKYVSKRKNLKVVNADIL